MDSTTKAFLSGSCNHELLRIRRSTDIQACSLCYLLSRIPAAQA